MTEQLRTMLHEQADSVDFAVPDVERLVLAGDRRVRRRNSLVAGGVLTAVLMVSALAALGGGHGSRGAPVVTHPEVTREVTWAKGSVIHVGDRTIEVGHEVQAYVETSVGFVVADPDGNVWSVVDGRPAEMVGSINAKHPRLVADPQRPRAAWVGTGVDVPGRVERSGLQVLDQSDGHVDGLVPTPGEVDAMSGDALYLHDEHGAVALGLATMERRVVDPAGPTEPFEGRGVIAAHDGTLAFRADGGTLVGPSRGQGVLLDQAYGSIGAFSADGTYYSNDADEPSVWEVRTGDPVPLPGMDDYAFATGFSWLDDHTLVLIAERGEGRPFVLVTCQVPAGTSCEQVAVLGSPDAPDFQLPVGSPIED